MRGMLMKITKFLDLNKICNFAFKLAKNITDMDRMLAEVTIDVKTLNTQNKAKISHMISILFLRKH